MADSFAIETGNPVQAAMPSGGSAVPALRLNTATGGSSSSTDLSAASQSGQVDGATSDALFKLAGDILAPRIKEAHAAQVLEGFQAATTGKALKEIVDERPWYTELFGPSGATMGARAYTVQAQIGKFGSEMEKKMPALAQQGPEALTKAAMDQFKTLKTGDALADQAIQSSLMEQLAPLYKRQAKENYIWTQKKANEQQVDAWDSMADAYQQRVAAAADPQSGTTKKDIEAEQFRLLGALGKFGDQTDESYEKNIAHLLQGAARKGNFAVVDLFEKQGLVKKLSPEVQGQLEGVFRTSAGQALNKVMPALALDVAMFVNDTAQDPRKIVERAAALNAKASALSGVDMRYAKLIPDSTLDNLTGKVLVAQAAERSKGAGDAQKQGVADAMLLVAGGVDKALATGLTDSSHVETSAMVALNAGDPKQIAAVANARFKTPYTTVSSQLQQQLRVEEWNKGTAMTADTYELMTPETRAQYFTDDQLKMLSRVQAARRAGVPDQQAFLSAKLAAPFADSQIPEADRTKLQGHIKDYVENANENMFGWNKVNDNSLRILGAVTSKFYKDMNSLHGEKQSVAMAMGRFLKNGGEIVGDHVILGSAGQKPLTDSLLTGVDNMGPKEVGGAFDDVMKAKAKEVGGTLDDYTILRAPDRNGDAQLFVESTSKDGKIVTWTVSASELRAHNKTKVKEHLEPTQGAVDTETRDWMLQRQRDFAPHR